MRDNKPISETTAGEIFWAFFRGVLIALIIGVPIAWLALRYAEPIRTFFASAF